MKKGPYAGPIPSELDVRLERRDTSPLPPGALVRFQFINRGPSPRNNHRWILYKDGRFHLVWHSGDVSDCSMPFDTELPETPTMQLQAPQVDEVRNRLRQANLCDQPPYQADEAVEDGGFYIVTARIDNRICEVIYEGIRPAIIDFLFEISNRSA